jgi:hypothetical protein
LRNKKNATIGKTACATNGCCIAKRAVVSFSTYGSRIPKKRARARVFPVCFRLYSHTHTAKPTQQYYNLSSRKNEVDAKLELNFIHHHHFNIQYTIPSNENAA